MSYTPPTYVDTKAQAILALASVVADEDKTNLGDGSVNRALDVLADAMAAQDVSVPQTNAGAILALAQYIGGGGGGGGEHSITCKVLDPQTFTLTDMPSRVSVAVLNEELHEWIPDPDPDFVDKAPSGTIMYASWYEEGPCYARFMGTVDPESTPLGAVQVLFELSGDPITVFPMANTDIVVLYVED